MIVGLNLSDRLYLAADSRVTFSDGTAQDNILKLIPILDRAIYNDDRLIVAVAGRVKLAKFLVDKLYYAFCKKKLSPDIRTLSKTIKPFLEKAVDEWGARGTDLDASCCLLFAGFSTARHKKINSENFKKLVASYEHSTEEGKRFIPTLEKLVQTDPNWKHIQEQLLATQKMGVIENLAQSDKPKIPQHLQDALDAGTDEIRLPDSLIFSASVIVRTRTVTTETAEWGELLVYGDRVTKSNVPDEILSTSEFMHFRERNQPHLMEGAMLSVTIRDVARDNNINSIGGRVMIGVADQDGLHVLGDMQGLIPFVKYDETINAGAQASL